MFNFKNFGTGFKVQNLTSAAVDSDKIFFIKLIESYISGLERSDFLMEKTGVNLMEYDEVFVSIIENMIYKHYGSLKGDIIIWYIYDRLSEDGTINPVIYEQDGKEEEIIIKDAEELWEFLETKIDKIDNNNE